MKRIQPKPMSLPMIPPPTAARDGSASPLQSPQPASDSELAITCTIDTADRTVLGNWVYPAVWLALALATGISERWPQFVWSNMAGLFGLAAVRAIFHHQIPTLIRTHRVPTEWAFTGLTLLMAGYWGALTGACIILAPTEGIAWMMLTLTVAFCAGGNTLFGIHAALRLSFPLAMVLPVAIAQALQPSHDQKIMMCVELALMFYLNKSSAVVHKDYWDARLTQRLSAEQACELEMSSLTDGLTQTANRLYFDRQFEYEWQRQCRHGGPVSVLMVDLDHFKLVNDTYGHPFGDKCLQQVAQVLMAGCSRSTDFVARYGGEEFVLLLAETDSKGARVVADRILSMVRKLTVEASGHTVSLTCSIGLATTVPHASREASTLIDDADRALYLAKNGGRDRVVTTDSSGDIPPKRARS